MLWKSCLGKSNKHLPPPPFPKQALICSHRNSDPGGNSPLPEQRKAKSPKPFLKKSRRRWELSTRAVLCRTNLGILWLGCEEHIAMGRECLSKPLYPLILWKVCSCSRGKEKPSLDFSDRKFPSSQQGGTGIALGRFCWQAEGAAPPPPPPPSLHISRGRWDSRQPGF